VVDPFGSDKSSAIGPAADAQASSVAGATIRWAHNRRGRTWHNADSTARSGHDSRGEPTWRRRIATSLPEPSAWQPAKIPPTELWNSSTYRGPM